MDRGQSTQSLKTTLRLLILILDYSGSRTALCWEVGALSRKWYLAVLLVISSLVKNCPFLCSQQAESATLPHALCFFCFSWTPPWETPQFPLQPSPQGAQTLGGSLGRESTKQVPKVSCGMYCEVCEVLRPEEESDSSWGSRRAPRKRCPQS